MSEFDRIINAPLPKTPTSADVSFRAMMKGSLMDSEKTPTENDLKVPEPVKPVKYVSNRADETQSTHDSIVLE